MERDKFYVIKYHSSTASFLTFGEEREVSFCCRAQSEFGALQNFLENVNKKYDSIKEITEQEYNDIAKCFEIE